MHSSVEAEADPVRENIRESAAFGPAFITMNALSAVMAGYGLLANSTAVIIGAMIVAMLLGPITGIALALVDADNKLLKKSLLAEAGGVAIVLFISIVIGLVHKEIPYGTAILSRTKPNILDLAIALSGGAAGAYAMVSPRVSASLVGVAIATALVPPLCVCGITLARGDALLASGGFLLFLANLVAIQFASSVTLALLGYHRITFFGTSSARKLAILHGPSVLLLLGLAAILTINFQRTLSERRFEIDMRNRLSALISERGGAYLADLRISKTQNKTLVIAVVRTPWAYSPNSTALMQESLPRTHPPMELHVRSIITKEAMPKGWINEPPSRAQAELGDDP